MLALIYLVAATYFGDRICRRFYRFVSIQQRIATSFLVGLLLSTWITYLASLAFARTKQPLIAGNIVFLISLGLVCYVLPRASLSDPENMQPRPPGSSRWDFSGRFFSNRELADVRYAWLSRRTISNFVQELD